MRPVDILDTSIEFLKGVGPVRAEILRSELGIFTFNHLLHHFPFRYVDKSKFYKISEINSDSLYVQLKGKIIHFQKVGKLRSERLVAILQDESGEIELVWFKGIKWVLEKLRLNEEYVVFGKPSVFKNHLRILSWLRHESVSGRSAFSRRRKTICSSSIGSR